MSATSTEDHASRRPLTTPDDAASVAVHRRPLIRTGDSHDRIRYARARAKRTHRQPAASLRHHQCQQQDVASALCSFAGIRSAVAFGGFADGLRMRDDMSQRSVTVSISSCRLASAEMRSTAARRARARRSSTSARSGSRRLQVPVPPLELQREFADASSRANSTGRRCSSDSHASLDALFASLQQRAFRGEL